MQGKCHSITISHKEFEQLQELQRAIPIRVSIPQTIEYLIKLGQKQIKSELLKSNVNEL